MFLFVPERSKGRKESVAAYSQSIRAEVLPMALQCGHVTNKHTSYHIVVYYDISVCSSAHILEL